MKKAILITVAACGAIVVSASAADVKENWDQKCKVCHGPDGKGDTKMGKKFEIKDLTDAKYQDSLKDDAMAKAIKDGVKDGDKTRMKAFGESLNDAEIKDLVAFVRKFKK